MLATEWRKRCGFCLLFEKEPKSRLWPLLWYTVPPRSVDIVPLWFAVFTVVHEERSVPLSECRTASHITPLLAPEGLRLSGRALIGGSDWYRVVWTRRKGLWLWDVDQRMLVFSGSLSSNRKIATQKVFMLKLRLFGKVKCEEVNQWTTQPTFPEWFRPGTANGCRYSYYFWDAVLLLQKWCSQTVSNRTWPAVSRDATRPPRLALTFIVRELNQLQKPP